MSDWLNERQQHGGIDEIPLPSHIPGRLWLCGKRAIADGQFAAPDTPWDTVVCLCRRSELADRYPAYVDWLDRVQLEGGDQAVWWPIADLGARGAAETIEFVDGLIGRLFGGGSVLVHCAAGVGRAGTTAVGILVRLGVPVDEALDAVRYTRPGAGPEAGPQRRLIEDIATFDRR